MAASTNLTPAQIELGNSLPQEDLPAKLRCAVCSKLAINAFRLPCCETAICENCQSTLPPSCPVCEHSPVSGADCTAYKSLRTTVRVFLKTEEKKREVARPKTNGFFASTPVQVTPTPTPTQALAPSEPPQESVANEQKDAEPISTEKTGAPANTATELFEHPTTGPGPESGLEVTRPESTSLPVYEEQTIDGAESKSLVPQDHDAPDDAGQEDNADNGEPEDGNNQPDQPVNGFGLEAMNGNFGMNFGGADMNQMQMMMAMQSGMNPAAFGSFPMMGMMDPMSMQNMMMSGGFGAQGMGMNMNMGMNGFNGGGNDWNGQQSWNLTQDNFNPNAPGMGNGDSGNFNSGFRSGNYGYQNQFNDFRRGGGYGFRGRGRGRGFYGGPGRGYHQGYNNQNRGGWAEPRFLGGNSSLPATNGAQAAEAKPGNVDEFGRRIRSETQDAQPDGESEDKVAEGDGDGLAREADADHPSQVAKENMLASEDVQADSANYNGDVPSADQHLESQDPSYGTAGPVQAQAAIPDVPFNAPTGPKAMRQGLPNTSLHHLKARGLLADDNPSGTNSTVVASPVEERLRSRSSSLHSRKDKERDQRARGRDRDADEKDIGRDRDRDGGGRSRTHSVSRSRSPSRSRVRKESRRHRRHRSVSVSEDDRDGDHRRRKHRSRKHVSRDDEDYKGRSREDKYDERSRSASPVERDHKRTSHRGHRDRDEKRRDREKERDRESDYDRHRRSGHRSHRDRDRDQERDRAKDRERRDRGKEKEKDRGKDSRHHSGKTTNAPPTPIEPSDKAFNPPTGPRGSFSIKGASYKPHSSQNPSGSHSRGREGEPSRRASQASASGVSLTSKDPHALEREARDRERLLKETQRLAGLTGGRKGAKRSRDDGGEDRGGRRKSRRSEAVSMEDEEGRMRRLEAEREGRRWD
ncbi:hypothetical protein F4778DRAFT_763117 [Xylariomycetidae sp. FL2044]|nr:hypothetical protein F4778DRAFT_763117 [Xylariomycetidae sp. FL2044]